MNIGKIGKIKTIAPISGTIAKVKIEEKEKWENGERTGIKYNQISFQLPVYNDKEDLETIKIVLKADYTQELEKQSKLLENKSVKGTIGAYISKDYKKSYSIETLETLKVQ